MTCHHRHFQQSFFFLKGALYLIVMWWQLIKELSDPVFLSWAVDIRHLLLWQAGKVDLDLTEIAGKRRD